MHFFHLGQRKDGSPDLHSHQQNNLLSCRLVGMSTEINCTPHKIGAKGSMILSQRSCTSVLSDEKKNSSLQEGKMVIL